MSLIMTLRVGQHAPSFSLPFVGQGEGRVNTSKTWYQSGPQNARITSARRLSGAALELHLLDSRCHHARAALGHSVVKLIVTLGPHRSDTGAEGVAKVSAGVELVDAGGTRRQNLVLGNARCAMQHQRNAGGDRQIAHAGLRDEAFGLAGIGIIVGPMHALAHIRNLAEFRLDRNAEVVGDLDNAPRRLDVVFER